MHKYVHKTGMWISRISTPSGPPFAPGRSSADDRPVKHDERSSCCLPAPEAHRTSNIYCV